MNQNLNFSNAVQQAEQSFKNLAINDAARMTQQHSEIYGVLANVYAVHVAGMAAKNDYAKFLKEKDVVVSDKPLAESHPTVSALIEAKDRKAFKQRISQYAQCVDVLGVRKVAVEDAAAWFDEPEEFGSKSLRGIAKALRIYRDLPAVTARNKTRLERAAKAKQEKVEELLETARKQPAQVAKLSTPIMTTTGRHVVVIGQVNSFDEVAILHVIDDQSTCDALILRHIAA